MPTKQILTKKEQTVFVLDDKGKKIEYKTGPKKGQYKRKIKAPARYSTELDVMAIGEFFADGSDIIVIENMGTSFGNSARSTRTTAMNFGKLLALAEYSEAEIVIVSPNKWKKDLGLTDDKLKSVEMAEKLNPEGVFRTPRGALLDGNAEAFLIRYWFLEFEYANILKDRNESK